MTVLEFVPGRRIAMQIVKLKIWFFSVLFLPLALLLTGCLAIQVGGEIQKGRMELMYGDPKVALAHFQRAAELDPDYHLNYSIFYEGVWTYVGRANFAAAMIPEARQALERARADDADNLAKLYLGIVLAQSGERDRGFKEIEAGLHGVADWYDHVEFYSADGRFWDPGSRPLRREIQKQLASLASREIATNDLVLNLAALGKEIELEIDRAKDHKEWYWDRRFHGDSRP
jgi:tetratricopeptide (TPR) repeat protein